MFSRYLSAHLVLVPHLHIVVIVEFTVISYDGFEQTQTAIVTLQLTATSAVVPAGSFTVLLTATPGSATGMCVGVEVCVRVCVHVRARVSVHMCVHACMRACVRVCLRACVSECVLSVCTFACLEICERNMYRSAHCR